MNKKVLKKEKFSFIKIKLFSLYKILAVVVLFIFSTGFLYIQTHKLNQELVVKQVVTKQITQVVAGSTPVEWTKIIKRSDITSKEYLLTLPKGSTNIRITNLSTEEAQKILEASPKELSTLDQRVASTTSRIKISKPKNFFFSKITNIFANFKGNFSNVAQASDVTSDLTVVDLSDQVVTTTNTTVSETETSFATTSDETAMDSTNPSQATSTTIIDSVVSTITDTVSNIINTVTNGGNSNEVSSIKTSLTSTTTPSSDSSSTSTTITSPTTEFVKVDYQTPAPTITEQSTDTGKIVTVSASELTNIVCMPVATSTIETASSTGVTATSTDATTTATATPLTQNCVPEQIHLTNVLASTKIPKIYKVGQESKIQIKWLNNDNQEMQFHSYDTDKDGYLDYVEWTVPHLSTQTFEIIFISKAFELDENKNIIGDIYDALKTQDNVWTTVPSGHIVRVTFNEFLTNQNDTTIYARPNQSGKSIKVEEYPVYTDQEGNQTQGPLVATFPTIDREGTYRILLNSLQKSTNVFDLKITGDADIDFVVDPSPITVTDTFDNSSKIASMVNMALDTVNGQVKLSTTSSFLCGSALLDSRDGKSYTTVLIGSQCWMKQNLNIGTMITGVTNQGTSTTTIQKYCYNNDSANCSTYGGLYQWNQAMGGSTVAGARGICPTGWHIPTHNEFTTLERSVCTSGTCATDFPNDTSTTGWRGTNEGTALKQGGSSGWDGLIAGYRRSAGSFFYLGSYAHFWSSLGGGGSAWLRVLGPGDAQVYRAQFVFAYGLSVRCLKD